MDDAFRCRECGAGNPVAEAMSEVVLAIAAERSVEPVLRRLVEAARTFARARYAAVGVPDGEGGFASFITAGMSERRQEAIGDLPRTHGLLGAMLETPEPYRTADIREDERFEGWPDAHPTMRSFLGVPIAFGGAVIGAFYLTNKRGGRTASFTDADQRLVEVLATHAAVAIENARLHERSRELSIVEERKRLARELHDSVTQTLFGAGLAAQTAAELVDSDPARAKAELDRLQELASEAMAEMRALIFELRPAEVETDGLVPALRKHVEVLARVYGRRIAVAANGEQRLEPTVEKALFRIAQEALGNALKHARSERIELEVRMPDGRVELSVRDDGVGFDPAAASARGLGLTSMRERAESLGAVLRVDSEIGTGTTVRVELG